MKQRSVYRCLSRGVCNFGNTFLPTKRAKNNIPREDIQFFEKGQPHEINAACNALEDRVLSGPHRNFNILVVGVDVVLGLVPGAWSLHELVRVVLKYIDPEVFRTMMRSSEHAVFTCITLARVTVKKKPSLGVLSAQGWAVERAIHQTFMNGRVCCNIKPTTPHAV